MSRSQSGPVDLTGSVYQRRSDGRWCAAFTVPGGRRRVLYAATEREARQRLAALIAQHAKGTLSLPTRITLAQWIERWMADAEHRPSTVYGYSVALAPLLDRIGQVRLDRLTAVQLAGCLADMRQQGIGTKLVQLAYVAVQASLQQAFRLGVIGVNVAERVDKPHHERRERRAWTVDEAQRFIRAGQRSRSMYAPLLLFTLGIGTRIGESLGIRWSDIDRQHGVVHIERALTEIAGKHVLTRPKTKAGKRTIALTRLATEALDRLAPTGTADGFVFVSRSGETPYLRVIRYALATLCREADVPRVSIHDLRRSHASLLAGAGVDVATVQRRLGHARASVTLDVYTLPVHPDQLAADRFNRISDDTI